MSVERERVFSGDRDRWSDQETVDELVLHEVHVALLRTLGRDALLITVDVEAGEVTLTGLVTDGEIRRRAAACAGQVAGVVAVRDRIRIGEGSDRVEDDSLHG